MAKAVSRRKKTKERTATETRICSGTPPRWRLLPPEVIHIILGLLKHDKATLRACSLATREFSCPALSYMGQHITLNRIDRIKQCAQLLTAHSAFQHVRSLDLGVTSKVLHPEDYLEEQFTILETFAERQTLTCLWLSNFPFPSIEPSKKGKIRDIIAALTSTVDNLGLYGCQFPSYIDMISFIRAFPRCDSLFVRDCAIGGPNSTENMFSGLPEHKLALHALELSSAASNGLLVDVSSLIEDAALDISQLSALTCGVVSAEQARRVAMATSESPIRHVQLACKEPDGFQAFFNPMAKKWSLESFTIGPISHITDRPFWEGAFQNFPPVPRLRELTIIYYYQRANAFDASCWAYFGSLFCRAEIPAYSMLVDIRAAIRSSPLSYEQRQDLHKALLSLRSRQSVSLWGGFRW